LWKVGWKVTSRSLHPLRLEVGRSEQLERARGAPPLAQGRAFEHHGAGIRPRHVEVSGIGARIDPHALRRPAEARRFIRPPAIHFYHAIIDVELEMVDEPSAELAERQAVPHRDRARADEALPPGPEGQALDRPAGGIGPVEHPDALAMLRGRLEHVEEGRDEGVDPAAEVLQVDQDRVERAERLAGRTPHLAVQAEHRDLVDWVCEVVGLDHIVLLVPAKPVLWTEGSGELQARRGERVEAVSQVTRDGGGMRQEGDALAFERAGKLGLSEEAVDAEKGHVRCLGQVRGEATGVVEIGLFRVGMDERPVGPGPVLLLEDGR
jgi:hypothetical protein